MDRRSALTLLAGGILIGCGGGGDATNPSAPSAPAATTAPLRKVAQVQSPIRIVQACPYWCWAASISMIFADNHHAVDQMRIVQSALGGAIVCTPGPSSQITGLLSRSWIDDSGRTFQSVVTAGYDFTNGIYAIDNRFIINELIAGRPLLYGDTQHAMVIVLAEYIDSLFEPRITNIGVIDPWPDSPGFHYLSASQLVMRNLGGEATYIASVSIIG